MKNKTVCCPFCGRVIRLNKIATCQQCGVRVELRDEEAPVAYSDKILIITKKD